MNLQSSQSPQYRTDRSDSALTEERRVTRHRQTSSSDGKSGDEARPVEQIAFAQSLAELASQRGTLIAHRGDKWHEISCITEQTLRLTANRPLQRNSIEVLRRIETRAAEFVQKAETIAAQLTRLCRALQPDVFAIARLLLDLDHEQLRLVSRVFRDRCGHDLQHEFDRRFSDSCLDAVRHALHGDRHSCHADLLIVALSGWRARRATRVRQLLDMIGTQNIALVENRLTARCGAKQPCDGLTTFIARHVPRVIDRLEFFHRINKRDALADACRIHSLLSSNSWFQSRVDDRAVRALQILERADPEKRAEIVRQHALTFGRTLGDGSSCHDATSRLSAPLQDLFRAVLAGDVPLASVHKLRCAFAGIHREWIGEMALFKSADELAELRQRFTDVSKRAFDVEFRRATQTAPALVRWIFGDEYLAVKDLYYKGTLSLAELLAHCIFGVGTDVAGIKRILGNLGEQEIRELRREYRATFPGHKLKADLRREVSGDDRFDVLRLLKGCPQSGDAWLRAVNERAAYEREGRFAKRAHRSVVALGSRIPQRLSLVRNLTRNYEDEGRLLERDFHHVRDLEIRRNASNDVDSVYEDQIIAAGRRFMVTADAFRAAKNDVVNFVANAVAGMTGATAAVGCGIALGPATLIQLGIAVGPATLIGVAAVVGAAVAVNAGVRGTVKYLIKGEAYGHEEIALDLLRSLISGTGSLFSAFPGQVIIKRLTATLTQTGLDALLDVVSRPHKRTLGHNFGARQQVDEDALLRGELLCSLDLPDAPPSGETTATLA